MKASEFTYLYIYSNFKTLLIDSTWNELIRSKLDLILQLNIITLIFFSNEYSLFFTVYFIRRLIQF